jgi:hypothetical protein
MFFTNRQKAITDRIAEIEASPVLLESFAQLNYETKIGLDSLEADWTLFTGFVQIKVWLAKLKILIFYFSRNSWTVARDPHCLAFFRASHRTIVTLEVVFRIWSCGTRTQKILLWLKSKDLVTSFLPSSACTWIFLFETMCERLFVMLRRTRSRIVEHFPAFIHNCC